jgi:hypothetical protein
MQRFFVEGTNRCTLCDCMSWDASISYIARDLFVEGTDCCALADYMAWKRIAHTIFTYLR